MNCMPACCLLPLSTSLQNPPSFIQSLVLTTVFFKKRFSEFVASVCRWISLLGMSDTQSSRLEVEDFLGRQVYVKLFFWVGGGGPVE